MTAPEPNTETSEKQAPVVTLRLPQEMVDRLDRVGRGAVLSRSEVIRSVLRIGLDMVKSPR